MVLKRLLVTTLGALGLGAFVAGTATAQTAGEGNIPAPDLFDDQIACSANVPTPPASLSTALMAKIASGEAFVDTDGDGVPDDADDAALAAGLGYVIDPHNANCGGGFMMNEDGMFLDDQGQVTTTPEDYVPVPVMGDIANEVAAGYTDTLEAFMAANMADEAAMTAQTEFDDLPADADADTVATAQVKLNNAIAAQRAAQTRLDALGAGPINSLGIAEWEAKGAVESALDAWNKAVEGVAEAETGLVDLQYASYVPLAIDDLFTGGDAVVTVDSDGEATVNLANLREYANAIGENTGVQAADGTVTVSNFDEAGDLIVPMELWDHDGDSATDTVLRLAADSMTYTQVMDRLDTVNDAVEALEALQKDNNNALLQPTIDEAVRRAQEEQDYYQGQYDAMVADTTNLNPVTVDNDQTPDVNEAAEYSLMSRYEAYTGADAVLDNAGVMLDTALTAREAATAAVQAAFTDAPAFYQQLVDLRTSAKADADAEVMRLAALTGEDAPDEDTTTAANDAAIDAAKALAGARAAQESFQSLLAEDSPVKDLVETLLETGGDDGGELVDAIVGAYDDAAQAMATADATAASVANLTGDEGAVNMNTTDIATNTTDIETNTTDIETNTTDIAENTTDIATNTTDIAENRTMIGVNAGNITTNSANIAANSTNIVANTTAIGVERGRIDQNVMDIGTNATGIMTNAGNIAMNSGRIDVNEMAIASNAGGIASNASMIGSNASAIGMNETRIGELSDELDVVRAGVAASMALAGMPAINGRGISIGVGTFDSESAFAVGFQLQGEMASFKIGVTSSGGETGASAGVGFQF